MELGNVGLSLAVFDGRGKGVTANSKEDSADMLVSNQFGIKQRISSFDLARVNVVTSAFFLTRLYLDSEGLNRRFLVETHNSPVFGNENKSGLGSSAASSVAVVKSLFLANELKGRKDGEMLHKVAQYSYAAYSKKVDSGFDIATCCVGHSIEYMRFDPREIDLPREPDSEDLEQKFLSSINKPWPDMSSKVVPIPSRYDMLFFNIEGARTSTLRNLRVVAAWKKEHGPLHGELIRQQNIYERKGIESFRRGDDEGLRHNVHGARGVQRKLQRLIATEGSGFDLIEPRPLSRLIEFGESYPGVVVGRCPGAGGWDGLAFVIDRNYLDEMPVRQMIQKARSLGLTLKPLQLRLS